MTPKPNKKQIDFRTLSNPEAHQHDVVLDAYNKAEQPDPLLKLRLVSAYLDKFLSDAKEEQRIYEKRNEMQILRDSIDAVQKQLAMSTNDKLVAKYFTPTMIHVANQLKQNIPQRITTTQDKDNDTVAVVKPLASAQLMALVSFAVLCSILEYLENCGKQFTEQDQQEIALFKKHIANTKKNISKFVTGDLTGFDTEGLEGPIEIWNDNRFDCLCIRDIQNNRSGIMKKYLFPESFAEKDIFLTLYLETRINTSEGILYSDQNYYQKPELRGMHNLIRLVVSKLGNQNCLSSIMDLYCQYGKHALDINLDNDTFKNVTDRINGMKEQIPTIVNEGMSPQIITMAKGYLTPQK